MFDDDLIYGSDLERGPVDAPLTTRAKIRLPWYRSLPLSCVEKLEVTLDDRLVPSAGIALRTNGHRHPASELSRLDQVEWFVLDAIDLELTGESELEPGPHRLAVAVRLRIPYGDEDFGDIEFVQTVRCSKELELAERNA